MVMQFSQIPNILTGTRIVLTVPIVFALLNHDYFTTTILFFIAGITDGLDGFIAKRFNCSTRLGSILDPASDKILLTAVFFTLFITNLIPFWLFILVFVRDLMIVTGAVGFFIGSDDKVRLDPSNISKINTTLQIFLVLYIVLAQLYEPLQLWLMELFIVTATTTFLSGVDYTWLWVRKFILQEKEHKCN
jgi:cardiolipin synthase